MDARSESTTASAHSTPPQQAAVASSDAPMGEAAPTTLATSAPPPPPRKNSAPALDSQPSDKSGAVIGGSIDKSTYNKFYFRMKNMAEEYKAAWKEVRKTGDPDEISVFVNAVIDSKGTPDDSLLRVRTVEQEDESNTTQGWKPFKQIADLEGWEVLLELVETGEYDARVNPQLKPDSKASTRSTCKYLK